MKEIYAFNGKDKSEWNEGRILGPFKSETEARKAIKSNLMESVETWDEFAICTDDPLSSEYHLFEKLKSFQPIVKINATITLKKL